MRQLKSLIQLPYFLFCVFVFYWSFPIGCLTNHIHFLKFSGKRNDMHTWSETMCSFFGIRFVKYGEEKLSKGSRNILYLSNHRSWADFFVDVYLTEGNAAMLSRMLVFFVFPIFMTSVVVLKGIILFKRGTIADKEKFNAWLDGMLERSPIRGMLVYPEGHRSTRPHSLPLKRGMLYYAHSRGMPVQIIISNGKEGVMSEKQRRAGFGKTVVVGFSSVIDAAAYKGNVAGFMARVQEEWNKLWGQVYSADPAGLPPLRQDPPMLDYSASMRAQQMAIAVFSFFALAGALWVTWRMFSWLTALAGPLQHAVAVLLLTWFAASIIAGVMGPSLPTHSSSLQQSPSLKADKVVSAAAAAAAAAAGDGSLHKAPSGKAPAAAATQNHNHQH